MFNRVATDRKVVESHDLNEFVKQMFGRDYSCAKGAEAGQDSYLEYDIQLPEEEDGEWWFATEYTLEEHRRALAKWHNRETSPDPGVILNELLVRGEVLAGKYIVLVSW
jgi:hypothetical protein